MVLSFANREPRAWIALLSALDNSGWQACGFDVVHAENETDHSKNGKNACTHDLLLDVMPARSSVPVPYSPSRSPATDEEEFCFMIGKAFLKVGALPERWDEPFIEATRKCAFLTYKPPAA